jgi:hypothetical protein
MAGYYSVLCIPIRGHYPVGRPTNVVLARQRDHTWRKHPRYEDFVCVGGRCSKYVHNIAVVKLQGRYVIEVGQRIPVSRTKALPSIAEAARFSLSSNSYITSVAILFNRGFLCTSNEIKPTMFVYRPSSLNVVDHHVFSKSFVHRCL